MHPKPVHKPTYHAPKPSYRPPPRGRPRPRPSLFRLPKLPKLPGLGGPGIGPGNLLKPLGPPKGHKGHDPPVDYGGWKPIGSYKVNKHSVASSFLGLRQGGGCGGAIQGKEEIKFCSVCVAEP